MEPGWLRAWSWLGSSGHTSVQVLGPGSAAALADAFFLGFHPLVFQSLATARGWCLEDHRCSCNGITRNPAWRLKQPEMEVFCDAVPLVSRSLNHPNSFRLETTENPG